MQGGLKAESGDLASCSELVERIQDWQRANADFSLREALDDPHRSEDLTIRLGPLYFDATRQRVDVTLLGLLRQYGERKGLPDFLAALSSGVNVNTSEQRPAHHLALRDLDHQLADQEATAQANRHRQRMLSVLEDIRTGQLPGARGQRITTLVNLGVGGSHLGSAMAVHALAEFGSRDFKVHFVSSMDGVLLHDLLPRIELDHTLFLISSKTFTTLDTFENVRSCELWMQQSGYTSEEIRRHFLGVSADAAAMTRYGIPADLQLEFMPSIGGRFSIASTIGMPLAAHLGEAGFMDFLRGMQYVDQHVMAEGMHSIPATMALLEWYNSVYLDLRALVVLPYHQRLAIFPHYLMQLQMESLGKCCTLSGHPLNHSGVLVFGDVGSDAQHSFMQLLHQGTQPVQADFIMYARMPHTRSGQRDCTQANALAQALALAQGYSAEEARRDFPEESQLQRSARIHRGNVPSSILLFDHLDPGTLGMLIALYEHKTVLLARLFDLNPFDQMGVELGKRVARHLVPVLEDGADQDLMQSLDPSTQALLHALHRYRLEGTRS